VLVLAAGAGTGAYFRYYRATPVNARPGDAGQHYAPVTLNADNSVTMARSGVAKPVLDVFEDFQCAECRTFELGNGRVIQQLAEQGKVKVVYHPFTVFSSQMQQASSVRAWAAAKCAPANRWVRYHNELYASQPTGTATSGFTTTLLVQLGRKAGITSPGFASCVRSQRYAAQNDPLSNQILNSGVNSAPVLMLNGRVLTLSPLSPRLRQHILSGSQSGPGTSSR
jgi:protein-disulfide isomerase